MENFEVSSRDSISDAHEINLPPVDRGKHAWLFLAACFIFEALIWGMLCDYTSRQDNRLTFHLQASRFLLVSSKTTIVPTSLSKVQEMWLWLEPAQWWATT